MHQENGESESRSMFRSTPMMHPQSMYCDLQYAIFSKISQYTNCLSVVPVHGKYTLTHNVLMIERI